MTVDRPRIALARVLLALLALLAAASPARAGMAFERRAEPREQAFTMLVPQGWTAAGGLLRVDPARAGGPLNSIEAKCDLAWRRDAAGGAEFRVLPDWVYAHAGVGAGLFPPGSWYQGAQVRPLEDAPTHLRARFAELRPRARRLGEPQVRRLPGEIRALEAGLAALNRQLAAVGLGGQSCRADAAGGVFDYEEDGRRYREVLVAGVVDTPAALSWKSTRTLAFRAPADEFEALRAVFDVMRASIRFEEAWVLAESQGQRERARIVLDVQREVRRVDDEILARARVDREELMNDQYLVLTGQEEYVDPHSGETIVDTGAWRCRWQTAGGDVFYTDREDEDPNVLLSRTGWQRTPVRKRANE